jgi:hypothetical protein
MIPRLAPESKTAGSTPDAAAAVCRSGYPAGPGRHAHAGCANRRAKGHSRRAGTPRIVQVGPSSVKGTPKILSNRFAKRIFGTHP